MPRPKDPHSLRSFAEYKGVSLAAVQRAIKDGRIIAQNNRIMDFETAAADWDKNTIATKSRLKRDQKSRGLTSDFDAIEEAARRAENPGKKIKNVIPGEPGSETGGGNSSALVKARTANEGFKAKINQLEYQKRAGELIEVSQAKKIFLTVATEVKERFLSIPDRIADILAAEKNPVEIRNTLDTEIRAALLKISGDDVKL